MFWFMLVSKDVTQIFSIGYGFFCPKPVKCDFISRNGSLVAQICNFISLSVTLYCIIAALNISMWPYISHFSALFLEIVILYLLILTLYAIIWLDIWECGFISRNCYSLSHVLNFISEIRFDCFHKWDSEGAIERSRETAQARFEPDHFSGDLGISLVILV